MTVFHPQGQFAAVAIGSIVLGISVALMGYEPTVPGLAVLLAIGGAALHRISWWSTQSLSIVSLLLLLVLTLLRGESSLSTLYFAIAILVSPALGAAIEGKVSRYLLLRRARWRRRHRAAGGGRRRLYCLHCFETLEWGADQCADCGQYNRPATRRTYWNCHPSLVRIERIAKSAIFLTTAIACVLVVPMGLGENRGWMILLPFAAGVALWLTAGKITRHVAYFQPHVVWGLSFALLGAFQLSEFSLWCLPAFVGAGLVLVAHEVCLQWKLRLQRA